MSFLFWAILSGYFIGWAVMLVHFETERERLYGIGRKILWVSFLAHLAWAAHLCVRTDAPALVMWQATLPILIIGSTLLVEWRARIRPLPIFSLPLVLLLSVMLGSRLTAGENNELTGMWLRLHLGFLLAGLASLIVSVSAALMYLWQSAQLKSRRPGQPFVMLPPLANLDRVHFRSLLWGVVLFSLGIAAGVGWAKDRHVLSAVWHDPKALLSLAGCLLCWVVVSIRLSAMRRGQKIAIGTLVAGIILLLAIGSVHVAPGAIHGGM